MTNHKLTLHVFSKPTKDHTLCKHKFVIESEINAASDDAHMEILASLTEYVNDVDESFPMNQGLLPYLVFPTYAGLPSLIIVYRRLKDRIETEGYTKIVLHDINDEFKPVIQDVAQATGIKIKHTSRIPTFLSRPGEIFSVGLLATLIDQIFSIVYGLLRYPKTDPDLLLLTSSGRDRNESLVINELSLDTTVITSRRTVEWLGRDYDTDYDRDIALRPLNSYSTFGALYKQIRGLASLTIQSIRGEWEIESGIIDHLKSDLDVEMNRTVHYACTQAISNSVQQLLSYYIIIEAFNKEGPSKVMVRGDSPRPRMALAAAEEQNIDLYYLPHSVTCGYEILPAQQKTTQFMPGPYEVDYLEKSPIENSLPDLVPTGRPIHEEFRNQITKNSSSGAEPIVILVATQPFDDDIRKKFAEVVVNAFRDPPVDYQVIFKIHPSESAEFYEDYKSNQSDRVSITVKSGEIKPYLEQADLTITINSNVGFESMITGTPTVSYNEWAPRVSVFPYQKSESVPVHSTEAGFIRTITELDREGLKRLSESQQEFIESGYYFEGSIERIKNIIE